MPPGCTASRPCTTWRSPAAPGPACTTWDGHRLEIYTSDYYTGDPGHPVLRWDVSDPRRRDFYGHAVVPSWYAEATTVLDLDGKPRPATEQHQILESAVGADGFRIR
jgi:hypothetical protein